MQKFSIAEHGKLTYGLFRNEIQLSNTFAYTQQASVFSTQNLLKKAIFVKINGWYHLYHNCIESAAMLIDLIPKDEDVRFFALPTELSNVVIEKWPNLGCVDYYSYSLESGANITVPGGYRVGSIRIEDLDFIEKHEPYISEYGRELLEYLVRREFTTAIFYENKIVAWVMSLDSGVISSIRVLPEHRMKKLSLVCTKYIIDKVENRNLNALAHVYKNNQKALRITDYFSAVKLGSVSWIYREANKDLENLENQVF